jgi:hypothetical protein
MIAANALEFEKAGLAPAFCCLLLTATATLLENAMLSA